jgi:voltage-gated potassium channel
MIRLDDEGRVLIFGCGPLGLEVADQLRARDIKALMIDDDAEGLERAAARGFQVRALNYTDDDELKSAGLGEDVGVVFSLFMEDSRNVFLIISARALDPKVRIVTITQSGASADKLLAAGASKVIDPYEISARKIHELIRRPLLEETLEATVFGRQDLDLAEIRIPDGSSLNGAHLSGLDLAGDYNLVLLGVVDRDVSDAFIFATAGMDHRLDAGDVLVVIGPEAEVRRLKERIR